MNGFEPFNTSLIVEKPGAVIKGLYLKNIKNKPDTIKIITQILRQHNLIIPAYLVSDVFSERSSIFVYIQLLKEIDIEGVIERLKDALGVSEVLVVDYPVKGFAYQPFYPLMVFGKRGIFFSARIFGNMFKGIREKLGSSATKAIMYYAGLSGGKARAADAKSERPDLTPKELLLRFLLSGLALGQYRGELIKFDEEKIYAIIRVRDSWESAYTGKGYPEPQCNFLRGLFEGFLEELFSTELESAETLCECKGDSYCQFEVRKPER